MKVRVYHEDYYHYSGERNQERKVSAHCNPRVNAIIDKLDILSNCSGSNYEYTEEQVETMFQAIRDAVDACYNEFRPRVKTEKERFSF